jgi:hypothetical protein
MLCAVHPPAQFLNSILVDNSYLIFIAMVVRHVIPLSAPDLLRSRLAVSEPKIVNRDFHFRSPDRLKSNRLRLELSVPKGSAVCSKKNTSITTGFDSREIRACAREFFGQMA